MKLLTYNFLTSKCIKGVKVGFPLKLTATKTEVQQTDFNSEFMGRILTRVDWPTVKLAADEVGCGSELPIELSDANTADQSFLEKVHHILMEIDIIEGALECPETGRIFPIAEGIPNMLLNEGEV